MPTDKKILMESLNIPIIESFDDLADELRLSRKLVYWLTIKDAHDKYKPFYIKKRSGKLRKINEPVVSLKTVQRWILRNILEKVKCSAYSYGFNKCGHITNQGDEINDKDKPESQSPQLAVALSHRNNLYLLKLDIKDFYPSITGKMVYLQFREIGYNEQVSNLLTNICTWEDSLPQGAPTSAYLANLICRRMDARIAGYCNKHNIVYTRYADDLMFSSDDRDALRHSYGVVKHIVEDEGFILNTDKTHFAGNKSRKEVLGITINYKRCNTPKEMKRNVRAMIHHAVATGDYSGLMRIRGYISYISSVEGGYKKKIRGYIESLAASDLCLHEDLVTAFNSNKVLPNLPNMVLKTKDDLRISDLQLDQINKMRDEYMKAHMQNEGEK